MLRQTQPLDDRLEADRSITPELLAVAARQPLEPATRYLELWFRVARLAVESNLVLVFDELADGIRIGRGVVVDARLPFEILDDQGWAA